MNVGRYKWLLFVLGLAVIAGALVVQRFHRNDTKTLTGFVASYGNFDKAIADFAAADASAQEGKASDALTELDRNASAFRLSSFVEHDADLMKRAMQSKSTDADRLATGIVI